MCAKYKNYDAHLVNQGEEVEEPQEEDFNILEFLRVQKPDDPLEKVPRLHTSSHLEENEKQTGWH